MRFPNQAALDIRHCARATHPLEESLAREIATEGKTALIFRSKPKLLLDPALPVHQISCRNGTRNCLCFGMSAERPFELLRGLW